ncbi:MAG: hypothetical protein KDA41_11295 [Planctomycetales bacterium]|nr:hypothetical protein [Planctomycetales bacterium]
MRWYEFDRRNRGGKDISEALLDNSEAMRLYPGRPPFIESRVIYLKSVGRHEEAKAWQQRLREVQTQLRAAN